MSNQKRLLVLMLALLTIMGVAAAPAYADNRDVQDQAGILNEATQEYVLQQNENTLKKVKGSPQLAFITRKNISNTSVEQYARDLANQYGIGNKDWDNGILFLIVTDTHKIRMQTGKGVTTVVPDSFLESNIMPKARPYLQQNDYDMAVRTITDIVCTQLSEHQTELPTPQDMTAQQQEHDRFGQIMCIALYGLIVLIAFIMLFKVWFEKPKDDTNDTPEDAADGLEPDHHRVSSTPTHQAYAPQHDDRFMEGAVVGALVGSSLASSNHNPHGSTHEDHNHYDSPSSDFGGFGGGFDGGGGATSSW